MGWSGSSDAAKKPSHSAKELTNYGVGTHNNTMKNNGIPVQSVAKAKSPKHSKHSTGSSFNNTTTVQSYEPKNYNELYNVRVNAQFKMEEEDMEDVFGENRFRRFYEREEIDAEAMNTAVTITN